MYLYRLAVWLKVSCQNKLAMRTKVEQNTFGQGKLVVSDGAIDASYWDIDMEIVS